MLPYVVQQRERVALKRERQCYRGGESFNHTAADSAGDVVNRINPTVHFCVTLRHSSSCCASVRGWYIFLLVG